VKKLLIISILILAAIFLTSMAQVDEVMQENQELRTANSDLQIALNEKEEPIELETVTKLTLNASGYTTGEEGVNDITASGETVQEWCTVAMGSSFEFGTKVYIPYFDCVFTVQDRGGAINDSCIDIYFNTNEECIRFGRQDIDVYILE
jgi:3D (Asp-Asp-Asp) domain-containing protein